MAFFSKLFKELTQKVKTKIYFQAQKPTPLLSVTFTSKLALSILVVKKFQRLNPFLFKNVFVDFLWF